VRRAAAEVLALLEDGPACVPELLVTDLAASLRCWRDALGFTVLYDRPEAGFAMLAREGAWIMLDQLNGEDWLAAPLERPFGRGLNLEFTVTDVDALHARARAQGLPHRGGDEAAAARPLGCGRSVKPREQRLVESDVHPDGAARNLRRHQHGGGDLGAFQPIRQGRVGRGGFGDRLAVLGHALQVQRERLGRCGGGLLHGGAGGDAARQIGEGNAEAAIGGAFQHGGVVAQRHGGSPFLERNSGLRGDRAQRAGRDVPAVERDGDAAGPVGVLELPVAALRRHRPPPGRFEELDDLSGRHGDRIHVSWCVGRQRWASNRLSPNDCTSTRLSRGHRECANPQNALSYPHVNRPGFVGGLNA
jgi:hypothetical protein